MRRVLTGAVAVAVTVGVVIGLIAPPAVAATVDDVRADAQWLLAQQRPDGVIPTFQGGHDVEMYPANHVAWGLARATRATGDRAFVDGAWKWLSWYAAHQDATGYVWDYVIDESGRLVRTDELDSTDATSAVFLLALHEAWRADGNLNRLRPLAGAVTRAVNAIESTRQPDGLTWAKPDWHVKYLMDNAEALAGLRAGYQLGMALKDKSLQKRTVAGIRVVRAGIETLWNPSLGSYDWAVHGGGQRELTDWRALYPDAAEQMWAVAFGASDAARSRSLVTTLTAYHANWDDPNAVTMFREGDNLYEHAVEWWPVIGWAFIRVGDTARAAEASARIRAAIQESDRGWPMTTSVVGQLIHLQLGGPQWPTAPA